jgi:CBS domain-containing protein
MNPDVATISTEANLVEAATMMRARNIGFLPVIENGKVVGVSTDRDIDPEYLRGPQSGVYQSK